MNTYRWNAKDYEKNSGAQQKWARELLDHLQQVARMELAECGAFRDDATVPPCSAKLYTGYET